MKRRFVFITLLAGFLSSSFIGFSQAPRSFSFQAVARNSSGELIRSSPLNIRLSIIAISDLSLSWQETHTVNTSDLGLFTVDVGTGTRTGGSATYFEDVNWDSERYSLKVELYGTSSWEDMGTSDLLSVPYALNAASVSSLKSLEVREAIGNPTDSALFEVKNNSGNTVFAVYNEGVRIYVDDNPGKSKGPRGGFAIGGFERAKGETFEFFRVTPDSVRIYVDETIAKGPRGGFAIGGFDRTKGLTADLMHLSEDNYFIGYESGKSIATGQFNSFFGYKAGVKNTDGNSNIFIGNETGYGSTEGNWNILLGNGVGYKNTFGSGNIILGDNAGYNNTTGSWNVIMGDLAGFTNSEGEDNVYIGNSAGHLSTTASYNVFLGSNAGYTNETGSSNVFLGESSGYSNTTGESNVFIGTQSGEANEIGYSNVFIGDLSGLSNISGYDNVFIGARAGELNKYGLSNVFIGADAGASNQIGNWNLFMGNLAGYSNTQGVSNVFMGFNAGTENLTGNYNVFIGTYTGEKNSEGSGNVFLGQQTGELNTLGNENVFIGSLAGYSNTIGNRNLFLGYRAGISETSSNRLYIDNEGNSSYYSLMYGEFDNKYLSFYADVDVWGVLSYYDLFGTSDKSLKENITNLTGVLGKVNSLNPVEFDWKPDVDIKGSSAEGRQIGLIAQDVELLFPELVRENVKGQKAVNYTKLTVILLEAMQEQQEIIELQKARLDDLENKINLLMGTTGNKD